MGQVNNLIMQANKVKTISKSLIFLLFISPTVFATNMQLELPKHINMVIPRTENSNLRRIIEAIYKESFKRLGLTVSFRSCAPAYCGKYVMNGTADGEMARTIEYENKYPNLVRTNEKIFTINSSAFSIDPMIKINTWDDMAGNKYKVAYMEANYIINKNLKNLIPPSNIIYVHHWNEGLKKLSNKKADIYVGVERTVLDALTGKETNIHKVGTVETLDLYPYFNKKHKLLAKKLAQRLKEMEVDGALKKIYSKFGL